VLSLMRLPPAISTLFPYTTLFRSALNNLGLIISLGLAIIGGVFFSETFLQINKYRFLKIVMNIIKTVVILSIFSIYILPYKIIRSEEHTSELQSRENLVCRLLLEK